MEAPKRNILLGSVAVGIFGLAAMLYFTRSNVGAQFPSRYTMEGVCVKCGEQVEAQYDAGEIPVGSCPRCGTQTVYAWMFCFNCKKRFVPNLVPSSKGGPPMPPVVPVCTGCGSNHTGAWVPDDPERVSVADLPLPALP